VAREGLRGQNKTLTSLDTGATSISSPCVRPETLTLVADLARTEALRRRVERKANTAPIADVHALALEADVLARPAATDRAGQARMSLQTPRVLTDTQPHCGGHTEHDVIGRSRRRQTATATEEHRPKNGAAGKPAPACPRAKPMTRRHRRSRRATTANARPGKTSAKLARRETLSCRRRDRRPAMMTMTIRPQKAAAKASAYESRYESHVEGVREVGHREGEHRAGRAPRHRRNPSDDRASSAKTSRNPVATTEPSSAKASSKSGAATTEAIRARAASGRPAGCVGRLVGCGGVEPSAQLATLIETALGGGTHRSARARR